MPAVEVQAGSVVDANDRSGLGSEALPALSGAMAKLRLRHLQLLDALDRLGSLRQVALELGIKQPATLSLIDDLEFAFGMPLVVRERGGSKLTPAARALLGRVRLAVQEVAMARQQALRSSVAGGGRLRLGASPYLISALLPELVAQLRRDRPGLEVDIREGTLDALVADLVQGELDAVLGSVDRAAVLSSAVTLDASFLVAERLCIVAGRGHPLYARKSATLAEVLAGPWVLPHTVSHIRGIVDSAVFDSGAPPLEPKVECRGIHNLLSIAAAGGLLTVAPGSEVARPAWRGRVALLDSPLRLQAPPYVFVSRRYAQPAPEMQALRELAGQAAQRLLGAASADRGPAPTAAARRVR